MTAKCNLFVEPLSYIQACTIEVTVHEKTSLGQDHVPVRGNSVDGVTTDRDKYVFCIISIFVAIILQACTQLRPMYM